eukprot:672757-Pelagomonas_calceolata.AAC.1
MKKEAAPRAHVQLSCLLSLGEQGYKVPSKKGLQSNRLGIDWESKKEKRSIGNSPHVRLIRLQPLFPKRASIWPDNLGNHRSKL